MTTLHLGVVDIPYVDGPAAIKKLVSRIGRRRDRTLDENTEGLGSKRGVTTGDVAGWLEDRYHIMELFFEAHHDDITRLLTESIAGQLENLLAGAPFNDLNPLAGGTEEIENLFRKFLSDREVEGLGIPGVPTQAALDGVSARFKSGYNPKGRRPSFIDTGLYEASFRAWSD
jgi:hypothetical protein